MELLCPSQSTTELCDAVKNQTFTSSWTPPARLHASVTTHYSVALLSTSSSVFNWISLIILSAFARVFLWMCSSYCLQVYWELFPTVCHHTWPANIILIVSACETLSTPGTQRHRVRKRRLFYRAENGIISFSFQRTSQFLLTLLTSANRCLTSRWQEAFSRHLLCPNQNFCIKSMQRWNMHK